MAKAQRKSKNEILPQQETILAKVIGTRFHNSENGYSILNCEDPLNTEISFDADPVFMSFTAVGHMAAVRNGDEFNLTGYWKEHPRWGRQFVFSHAEVILPNQKDGIMAWFASAANGVGAVRANIIYDKLGPDCLEIIKERGAEHLVAATANSPHRITIEMATELYEALSTNEKLAQLTAMIAGDGLSAGTAARIYHTMGKNCIEIIKQNPYVLADEIHGIGFKKADVIAQRLGVEANSPFRYQSAAKYALNEASSEGHCYLSPSELIAAVKSLLGKGCAMAMSDLRTACEELARQNSTVLVPGIKAVYKRSLYEAETELAELLIDLTNGWKKEFEESDLDEVIATIQVDEGVVFGETQKAAIKMALIEPLCIITGGPGTGKTTITNGILKADRWADQFRSIYLSSPTGRAAKRMSEVCGREATTIHRLLKYMPMGNTAKFQHGKDNPLEPGRFIIDEASMVDISLAKSLFEAIECHPETQVVIVGDIDQLPSVGPGSVLRDMIESQVIPTVRLTYNYRQDKGSKIPALAAQVVEGTFPEMEVSADYLPVVINDAEEALEAVKQAVGRCVDEGINVMDFQVLAPMYRGVCGVDNINTVLQEMINPMDEYKTEIEMAKRIFRSGDKVLVLKNDYQKGVFNGDQGIIVEALKTGIHVDFSEGEIGELAPKFFTRDELNKLALAYCTTVHKSQGSEYKVVIMVLLQSHYIMLKRNLFYTGITRARDRLVLVHQEASAKTAVANEDTARRNSKLRERLVAGNHERNKLDKARELPHPQGYDHPF